MFSQTCTARTRPVRSGMPMIAGLCAAFCASVGNGDALEMIRSTIDGGGAMHSAGAEFELSGTIGQVDAGEAITGGGFELTGGFWFPVAPTDCNEDGGVGLLDYRTFVTCLTGPAATVVSGCECYDVNHSGTIDLRDFTVLQVAYSAP